MTAGMPRYLWITIVRSEGQLIGECGRSGRLSPTLRRIVKRNASNLDDVENLLTRTGDQVTLIFDVDNTLVRQGAPTEEFIKVVNTVIDRFERHPSVGRVIALTNGAQRGVPRLVSRGNKPWTTRRRLGLTGTDGLVVVGDQVLTDGLLARRLGATFVHLVIDDSTEPPDQSRMRRQGRRLEPLLFKKGSPETR
jgi:predicted HAD superfamily phosphohydrolase YqeG